MLKKIMQVTKSLYLDWRVLKQEKYSNKIRSQYIENGKIPWSKGYYEYKKESILYSVSRQDVIDSLRSKMIPIGFGYRLDERIVEYSWVFSKLKNKHTILLDAGSTFNFDYLLDTDLLKLKEKYIYTFYPEKLSYNEKQVSYIYGDLRSLPFKDEFFEEIVSLSTIEHIDMDNSIYGYDLEYNLKNGNKSYEYLLAVKELIRVLKREGLLLITFPFGKYENHGFFQQFDGEMLDKLTSLFHGIGTYDIDYFKYEEEGWRFADRNGLKNVISYNPHTGKGKLNDGAAHCRSVACIAFRKN